jgi:hypothetical protein
MRTTWFRLTCWAVLALCSLPAVAAQKPEVAEKKDTKVIGGEVLTREQHADLRKWMEVIRRMKAEQAAQAQRRPEPPAAPDTWERLPEYWPLPPPDAGGAREVRAALEEARTFYMADFLKEMRVSGGFPAPLSRRNLEVDVQVTGLRNEKGRKVPFQPSNSPISFFQREGFVPSRVDLYVAPAPGHVFPDELEGWKGVGVAKVRMPAGYRVLSFTAADVGKTQEGITLKAWSRSRVELEDSQARLRKQSQQHTSARHPESAELVGLTAEGRRLQTLGRSESELPVREAFAQEVARLSWDELPAVMEAPPDFNRQVVRQGFAGKLARLDVYLVTRVEERKLALRIVPKPGGVDLFEDGATEVPPRTLCEVSAASLEKDVRIFASRVGGDTYETYGKPMVAAQLPVCDNTWFSNLTLRDLKYLDAAGKPVAAALESEKSRRPAYSFGHEFFFVAPGQEQPVKDPTLRELARIEGVARVTVPRLRVLSLTRKSPQAEGATLLVEGEAVRLRMPAALHARRARGVTAYDAKGRLLEDIGLAEPVRKGEQVEEIHRYALRWERIDLLLVEEQVQAELPFAVTLPPAPEPPPPPTPKPAEEKPRE